MRWHIKFLMWKKKPTINHFKLLCLLLSYKPPKAYQFVLKEADKQSFLVSTWEILTAIAKTTANEIKLEEQIFSGLWWFAAEHICRGKVESQWSIFLYKESMEMSHPPVCVIYPNSNDWVLEGIKRHQTPGISGILLSLLMIRVLIIMQ